MMATLLHPFRILPLVLILEFGLCTLGYSRACELCAIYSADNARGGTSSGFQFTISEQYSPYQTTMLDGAEIKVPGQDYMKESITHFVPSYNFNRYFGLSLNIPYVDKDYFRAGLLADERGSVSGLGDASVIGRFLVFGKAAMNYSVSLNFLGGIKLPTGSASFLDAEAEESRLYNAAFGPGHAHGVIPGIGGVHYHALALGSGSVDGIFGLNFNSRWKRAFFSAQAQYYLRTEGEATFEFGDMLMFTGGPGIYLLSNNRCTLNLQWNGVISMESRSRLFGEESDQTGLTSYYLGPQASLTVGRHFTAIMGMDVPLKIYNSGLQAVPDYRLHGSVSWRF
jgi:hypothetical protein